MLRYKYSDNLHYSFLQDLVTFVHQQAAILGKQSEVIETLRRENKVRVLDVYFRPVKLIALTGTAEGQRMILDTNHQAFHHASRICTEGLTTPSITVSVSVDACKGPH